MYDATCRVEYESYLEYVMQEFNHLKLLQSIEATRINVYMCVLSNRVQVNEYKLYMRLRSLSSINQSKLQIRWRCLFVFMIRSSVLQKPLDLCRYDRDAKYDARRQVKH